MPVNRGLSTEFKLAAALQNLETVEAERDALAQQVAALTETAEAVVAVYEDGGSPNSAIRSLRAALNQPEEGE